MSKESSKSSVDFQASLSNIFWGVPDGSFREIHVFILKVEIWIP